eukprot:COSAG06_NODE_76859_length_119_cov_23.450000_1_plen_22_part_01
MPLRVVFAVFGDERAQTVSLCC